MRAAVLGLGSIGLRHARNLKTLGVADLIGMDPDESRRQRFLELGTVVPTLDAALATHPDLIIVASPNRYHVAQAQAAAEAGCHLLIEKPLGSTSEGVDALVSAIAQRRLFAHVGSNWKFHPAFMAMKRMLDEGGIGRIVGAQVLAGQWLPDWHPWEDYRQGYSARSDLGGGIVLDTHEIDYLTWLLGPVQDVSGMTARSGALEIETEDVAAVCLRFVSGALATVQVDYIQRDYRRQYHITGDRGTIEWDMRTGVVSRYSAETRQAETVSASLVDINDMYLAQMRHVLDGVEGKCTAVTPVAQAARVLMLQLAVKSDTVAA